MQAAMSPRLRWAASRNFGSWWREQDVGRMAAVAGAGAPPAPLVVAGAPAVVPRAVGEHELHVGAEGGDGLFEDGLVVGEERV